MEAIRLIPQDLRRQELLLQVSQLIDSLTRASDIVFTRIEDKIREFDQDLEDIDQRAESASSKVDLLRTSYSNRVVRIYCSSKYPTREEIGCKDYVSLSTSDRRIDGKKKKNGKNDEKQVLGRGIHIPFSEEVLKEKLLFYPFPGLLSMGTWDKEDEGMADVHRHPLGRIPFHRITTISSLVLFDSSSNPYMGSSATHVEKAVKKRRDEEDDVAVMMTGLRGNSPLDGQEESVMSEDDLMFRYQVNQSTAPTLIDSLPSALPDLDGIAQDLIFDDVDSPDMGPSFFSPVRKDPSSTKQPSKTATSPVAHSMPSHPESSTARQHQPVPAPRRSSIASSGAAVASVPPPPPIPPPPPPPMPPLHGMPPAPPPPPPPAEPISAVSALADGGRASLLDSIRKAGGKPKKGQASVKDLKIEKKKIKQAEKTAAGAGDLMGDLINSLKARRIGISGGNEVTSGVEAKNRNTRTMISTTGEDATAGAMSRISSMIPAPAASARPRRDTDHDDSDDDWE